MNPYDRVEYPSKPFPQCHPERLAAMARLYGIPGVPVEDCRVLEVGCGDGLNLLSAAMTMPHARFVGIDRSGAAIRRGRRMQSALGLGNVKLWERDLQAFPRRGRKFDYIFAHGLYSMGASARSRCAACHHRGTTRGQRNCVCQL